MKIIVHYRGTENTENLMVKKEESYFVAVHGTDESTDYIKESTDFTD